MSEAGLPQYYGEDLPLNQLSFKWARCPESKQVTKLGQKIGFVNPKGVPDFYWV